MINVKCIEKFRDNKNRIYGYRLLDLNGKTQDVTPEKLKEAINSGHIHVINLTLAKDGRLMDTSEKQLQSKKLGDKPVNSANKVVVSDKNISDLAKAFTIIDWSLVDMGCSFSEIVENTCISCGTKFNSSALDDEDLIKISNTAYQEALNTGNNYIKQHIQYIVDDNSLCESIKESMYLENVNRINDSKVYRAVYIIYKYFSEIDKKLAKSIKINLLNDMKENGIASIKVGYSVGNEYFKYLDRNIFGTITNSCFTVGSAITNDYKSKFKELKPYSYMCSKDFNKLSPRPEVAITFLFRNGEQGKVIVDVKLGRRGYIGEHCCTIVGYIKDLGSFTLDINNKNNAKIVADYCNKLGVQIQKFAEEHTSLLHLLPLGDKAEDFN